MCAEQALIVEKMGVKRYIIRLGFTLTSLFMCLRAIDLFWRRDIGTREQGIGLAGQRSPRTPKVPGSIPDLAVSMQFEFMLKM